MANELEETIENTIISVVPASNYHLNKQRAADALARLMGPSNGYMAAQKDQSQRVASGADEIAIQLMMQGFAVGYEPVETPEEVAMQLYARVDDPKAEQEMQNLLADYFKMGDSVEDETVQVLGMHQQYARQVAIEEAATTKVVLPAKSEPIYAVNALKFTGTYAK